MAGRSRAESSAGGTGGNGPRAVPWTWLLFYLVLAGAVVTVGILTMHHMRRNAVDRANDELASIADLKANEIYRWRQERIGDARVAADSLFLSGYAAEALAGTASTRSRDGLAAWMDSYVQRLGYRQVDLVDPGGAVILSTPGPAGSLDAYARGVVQEAMAKGDAKMSDLHYEGGGESITLDVAAPIPASGANGPHPAGALLMRIDPDDFLYPYIQSWPTPSPSAETLLVRPEGDEVVFLNELRHRSGTALSLRLPLGGEDLPAAMAARGIEGEIEGHDYRGVEVLAALRRVRDSSWYLVAKIDREEGYAVYAARYWLTSGLTGVLVLLLGLLFLFLWSRKQQQYLRLEYEFEDAARRSERLYRLIVDNAHEGIWTADANDVTTFVNPPLARMLGYSVQEMIGRPIDAFVAEEDGEAARGNLARRREGIAEMVELRLVRKDGSPMYALIDSSPLIDDEGDYVGAVAMILDDSERRSMLEALRASEEEYRSIVDNAIEGIWTVDMDSVVSYVNQRMADMLGYSVQEMIGASFFDFVDEEHRTAAREHVRRRKEGISETYVFEFTRRDGSRIVTDVSSTPVLDKDGRIVGATALVSDITERKRTEDKLREIRDYLDSLIEYANAPIIVWDPSRVITRFNRAFEFLTGYGSDEVVGRDLAMLFPESSREESLQNIADTLGGEYWESVEIPILRKDGEVRIALWNSANIYAADGTTLVATIAQGQDITERKRTEEALAREVEVNKALAELSRALLVSGPIEEISCMILENAKRFTGSPFGYVGYIDTRTSHLVVPAYTEETWEKCEVEGRGAVFRDFTGLWGWVLLNREPLLANSPSADGRSSGTPPGHIPIERFISVPALMGDTLVGQLSLANSDRDYTRKDVDLMNRLADIYAIAVLRMWSEGELERYREHLEDLVRERTADLEHANRQLQEEIAERRRQQEELRSTAAQLRALSARLQSVREEERKSISLDVHDKLGQALTGLKMQLSLLAKRMPGEVGMGEDMAGVMALIDATIQSVREICTELRPGLLDDLGLIAALDWQVLQFEQQTGIACSFTSCVDDCKLGRDLSTALFRITQEALTNVARHAGATRVEMRLDARGGDLVLIVKDNGGGFSVGDVSGYGSLGILGMKERAYALGGEVVVSSGTEGGTTLVARIPVSAGADGADGEEGA